MNKIAVRSGDKLMLVEDYVFYMENTKITIPEGYRWNGANIPDIFTSLVGGRFDEENLMPSLVHDYLIDLNWDVEDRDLKFYSTLLEVGRNKQVAYVMYMFVRLYSKIHF